MAAPRPRVLLVEDDDDNRELMAEVLETAGYDVRPVPNGAEGVKALAGGAFDAVVTDVGMPGVGGLELARASKKLAPEVPVVVVTGYGERDDITGARGREVDAILVKPVDPDALAAAVAEVVRAAAEGRRSP
jgi:CheY-like chemotaxis protein